MKVLMATPTIYEKSSPFNHLLKDILEGLIEHDDSILRLVAVPNKIDDSHELGIKSKNVEYIKFKRKQSGHRNILSRYIRDNITSIRQAAAILKLKNVDVVFEDITYSSYWILRAAKRKKIKVVSMFQDVWPDNAVMSGLIRENSSLYKFFEHWQKIVYKKSDSVICISEDMKNFLIEKGVAPDKIQVIYNWGYDDKAVDIGWEENQFVKKYDLNKDTFYAIYAGNIGKMQNVEIIIDAAKKLHDEKDIQFLIIGDGARRKEIEMLASGVSNITLLPMQPQSLATSIYSAAGVNIIPLVPGGIKTALPSKTGVVLSCGEPTVFAFGREAAFNNIIKDVSGCMCVSSADSSELADAIKTIKAKNDFSKKEITDVYEKYFERSININAYINVIEAV